jgi:hypothetical protein
MFEYHRTKRGDQILICTLKDDHLINTIKYFLNKFKNNGCTTKEIADKISPYVLEATLRGRGHEIYGSLTEAFGRNQKAEQKNHIGYKASYDSWGCEEDDDRIATYVELQDMGDH